MEFKLSKKRHAALTTQIEDACATIEDNTIFDAMSELGFGSAGVDSSLLQIDLRLTDLQLVAAAAALTALAAYENRPARGALTEVVE